MSLYPMTKLVQVRPHEEPAMESCHQGVSVYRAARADARFLHKLLPIAREMAVQLARAKKDPFVISALSAFHELMEERV